MKHSQESLAQLEKQLDKALVVLSQNLLRLAIMQGRDIEIEAQFKEYGDQELEYIGKADKAKESKSAALSLLIDKEPSPASVTSAFPMSGSMVPIHNSESRFLITHLKPTQNLNLSMHQADVKQWKVQFSNYFIEANLQKISISAQEAHAQSCIDGDLWRRIKFLSGEQKLLDPAGEFTTNPASKAANSLFTFIDSIFAEVNPILNRRLDFFNLRQKPNEPVDHAMTRFMEAHDNANIDEMDTEDFTVCFIYNFITDANLKKELFKVPPRDRKRTRIRQEIAKWNHLQAQIRSNEPASVGAYYVSNQSLYLELCCACGKETPGDKRPFCTPCYYRGPNDLRCSVRDCPCPYDNHDTSGHYITMKRTRGHKADWSMWKPKWPPSEHVTKFDYQDDVSTSYQSKESECESNGYQSISETSACNHIQT